MFDTININLKSIDTHQLNFVKTVTRDLNVDTTTPDMEPHIPPILTT